MARKDKRINQLTPSSDPLLGTDLVAIWATNSNPHTRHQTIDKITSYVALNMTGITSNDTYVTGATLNVNSLELGRNQGLPTLSVDLSSLDLNDKFSTGGTLTNGTLVIRDNQGSSFEVTGFSETFTGNTSGSCITDLYVSNVYGCSPITVHNSIKTDNSTILDDGYSFAFGNNVIATANNSHATGYLTSASGDNSHAEGEGLMLDKVQNGETYVVPSYQLYATNGVAGYDTYQLYLSGNTGASNLHTIYGNKENPLIFPGTYNSLAPFAADIGGVSPAFWAVNADSEFDSWLTVGVGDGSAGSAVESMGLDFSGSWPNNNSLGTPLTGDSSAVFWLDPSAGSSLSSNVIVAQITIPTGSIFNVKLNAQGRSVSGEDWYQEDIEFTNGTPSTPQNPLPSGLVAYNDRADWNGTGDVNITDLLTLLTLLPYQELGDSGYDADIDINSDGFINIDELQLMLNALGQSTPMPVTNGALIRTTASGKSSHAQGVGTTASGIGSHSEGRNTTASGDYSHVGGNNSIASGSTSFIHSTNSLVTGDRSVVLGGVGITASGDSSIAVGVYTFTNGQGSFAGGYNQAHTVVGDGFYQGLTGITVNGNIYHVSANGEGSFVYGGADSEGPLQVDGTYSQAFGYNNVNLGNYSAVFGRSNFIQGGQYSLVSGIGNAVSGTTNLVSGQDNTLDSSSEENIVGGNGNRLVGATNSIIVGQHGGGGSSETIGGTSLIVAGSNNSVGGTYLTTNGSNNTLTSVSYSSVFGSGNEIQEDASYSYVFGDGNISTGEDGAFIAGLSCTVSGVEFSTAIGVNHVVTGDRTVVLGGSGISGTTDDTVYVPNFNIDSVPTTDNSIDNILVRNTDGSVQLRTAASLSEEGLWNAGTGTDAVVLANSGSIAFGITAVAEGSNTTAGGDYSHAEGIGNIASGIASHAEGGVDNKGNLLPTSATTSSAHAEGAGTLASGESSHAEGEGTTASANFSHAEGKDTVASDESSHAEGEGTTASGQASHAEGLSTIASANFSHAEGNSTTANGLNSHAEGSNTETGSFAVNSHAGGASSIASGHTSFIHSTNSIVTGDRSVVLGGVGITGTSDDTVYTPDIVVAGNNTVSSYVGGGELNLNDPFGPDGTWSLTSDNGGYGAGSCWLYGQPLNGLQTAYQMTASEAIGFYVGPPTNPALYNAKEIVITDNSIFIASGGSTDKRAVMIGAKDSRVLNGVINSVVLGGDGIIADTNNTVYVPHLKVNGQSNTPVYNSGSGTTFTLDFNNSNIQTITLTGNTTINNPSNVKDGAVYTVIMKQGATTGTINSWGSNFKFEGGTAPTLTTNAYAVDIMTFISDDAGILYGLIAQDFQ